MQVLSAKVIGGIALVIAVTLFISLAKEMNRRLQVQHEVQKLEQEVQNMQRTIVEMENLNHYFQTDAYQERLAREKLNYQATGEKVVLIPENNSEPVPELETGEDTAQSLSIPARWWHLFFVDTNETTTS